MSLKREICSVVDVYQLMIMIPMLTLVYFKCDTVHLPAMPKNFVEPELMNESSMSAVWGSLNWSWPWVVIIFVETKHVYRIFILREMI